MDSLERKKSPPFLELSQSTLQALQQSQSQAQLDFGNVLTLWTTLIKSSDVIKNGKRLENISWRVVNRHILLKNDYDHNDYSALIQISAGKSEQAIPRNKKQIRRHTPPPDAKDKVPLVVETTTESKETTAEVSTSDQESEPESVQNQPQKLTQRNLHHQQNLIRNTPGQANNRGQMFFIENTMSPEPEESPKSVASPKVKSLFDYPATEKKDVLDVPHKAPAPKVLERDRSLERLNQQQLLYGTSRTGAESHHSPRSETQRSQVSLFDKNNSKQDYAQQKILFSSDDEFSDGSDWSSMSGDSDFDDDDIEEEHLDFNKTDVHKNPENPTIKRSLLSGLFLDKMDSSQESSEPKKPKSPRHVVSPVFPPSKPTDRPDLSKASISSTNVNATGDLKITPDNDIPSMLKKSSAAHGHQQDAQRPGVVRNNSSNNPHMVSKSAVSLASFLANSRRPYHSTDIHNGHYERQHESNAPPTATTLLPTALSTHMFLPTMNLHRQPRPGKPLNSRPGPRPYQPERGRDYFAETHASHDHHEESGSVSSSVKSIDIPGSLPRSRSHMHRDPESRSSSRPRLDKRGSSIMPRGSPSAASIEVLTKELPSNLVESINNENKLVHASSTNVHELQHKPRVRSHLNRTGSSSSTLQNGGVSAEEDSGPESEISNNIIANGIMGNKLKLLSAEPEIGPFIDDYQLSSSQAKDDDWEDNLNYHARGW